MKTVSALTFNRMTILRNGTAHTAIVLIRVYRGQHCIGIPNDIMKKYNRRTATPFILFKLEEHLVNGKVAN